MNDNVPLRKKFSMRSYMARQLPILCQDKRFRYLAVGGINTFFGYCFSLICYQVFHACLHIVIIGAICNVVSISFSFVLYKLFVFRTKGHWLQEYARCYVVYGVSAVLGILAAWVMVDYLDVAFWLAQAIVIAVTVCFSYVGHSRFSFRT